MLFHLTQDKPRPQPRVTAGGWWATFGKGSAAALSVVAMAMLARVLSAADFSAYVLAFSIVAFGAPIGALGVNFHVIRMIAESIAQDNWLGALSAIRMTFAISAAGALAGGAIFYCTAGWLCGTLLHSPILADVAGWVACWIAIQSVNLVLAETYRGLRDIRSATIFGGLLYSVAFGGAAVGFLSMPSVTLHVVMYCAVGGALLNLVLGLALLVRRLFRENNKPAPIPSKVYYVKSVLAESLPMMITSVGGLAMTQADLWIVASHCSDREVAIYGAVGRLMMVVTMPLLIVNSVVPPMIAGLYTQGRRNELERVLRVSATLAGIPAIAGLIFMATCSHWFLGILFGQQYSEGAAILTLLCAGQAIFVWGGSAGWVLLMTGHSRLALVAQYSAFVLLLAAGFWAAPRYGAIGVAASSAAAAALCKVALVMIVLWKVRVWSSMCIPRPGLMQPSQCE